MTSFAFKKASKAQSKLRLGIVGPSGSGKTYSSLRIAKGLGGRIAVIDSERGSASKYAGEVCDFDVLELETFSPTTYVEAIHAAEREGYDVLIIDSLSHAWMGKDGALELVDKAAKRSQSANSFTAWRDVTPQHNDMVEAILSSRCHVIATMRAKTEYDMEIDARGKKVPVKIGTKPIQRDGMEYEFDVVCDLTHDHRLLVGKTRCSMLDRAVIEKPGEDVAAILMAWLSDGEVRLDPKLERRTKFANLVQDLDVVRDAAKLEELRATAADLKAHLSRDEQITVSKLITDARLRIARVEQDQAEAAEAEKHLARAGAAS